MSATQPVIIPPRVPLTDPRTGMIAREWYLYFLNIQRVAESTDVADFTVNDTGTLSGDAQAQAMAIDALQVAGLQNLPELAARVQALANDVDDLRKGRLGL